jgi:hypothetical protein
LTTIDDLLDTGEHRHRAAEAGQDAKRAAQAGLYWSGWAVAKLFTLILLAVGGTFYGVGWVASRAVWPALCWTGRAVRVGWDDGRHR